VTDKQTPPKTEAEVSEQRKCSSCDKSNTALFTLIIPPIITEKTELCRECLNRVLDNEKRKKSEE
jgi:hypothetical protein